MSFKQFFPRFCAHASNGNIYNRNQIILNENVNDTWMMITVYNPSGSKEKCNLTEASGKVSKLKRVHL